MTVINATLINLKKKEKKIEHSRPDACNYVDQNVTSHVSSPEGPEPLVLRKPVEGLSLGKPNPSGRLLERRAEPRYYPDSMYRMKL